MKSYTKAAAAALAVAALLGCDQRNATGPTPVFGGSTDVKTGNGAPSGAHYTLNIIGVPRDKSASMTGNSGHRIFVKLEGNSRIMLIEGDSFSVLDANGTDGAASFQLPNPDPDGDGTTVYSVFARALGKIGGSSVTTTCATDPDDGSEVCSVETLTLTRNRGPSKFTNVSKELLYIYADLDDDGSLERVGLFDDRLEDYFWDYDNTGLRVAQLRFYDCSSTVPEPTNSGGATTTSCFN